MTVCPSNTPLGYFNLNGARYRSPIGISGEITRDIFVGVYQQGHDLALYLSSIKNEDSWPESLEPIFITGPDIEILNQRMVSLFLELAYLLKEETETVVSLAFEPTETGTRAQEFLFGSTKNLSRSISCGDFNVPQLTAMHSLKKSFNGNPSERI